MILRRQWVEHERLAYPLAQVALAMIEDEGRPSLLKPFFKSRLMWIGFAIPFLVGSLNALHHYFPSVGQIGLNTSVSFLGTNLPVNLNFLMLGFSFLINSTLSLSLWFFLLVYTLATTRPRPVGHRYLAGHPRPLEHSSDRPPDDGGPDRNGGGGPVDGAAPPGRGVAPSPV